MVGGVYPSHGPHGVAGRQRESELLILVSGGDVFVGVGFDADGHPNHHVLHDSGTAGDGIEAVDLGHRVHHHVTDAGLDRVGEFIDRFVVAVQGNPVGGEPGMKRDGKFAAAGNVQREPLISHPSGDLRTQERLGRIVHVVPATECRGHLAAAAAEVVLINDEQWRPELLGKFGHGDSGDTHHTVAGAVEVARPDIRVQSQHVGRRLRAGRHTDLLGFPRVPRPGRMDVHIRSGAETPRMPSPLAIT